LPAKLRPVTLVSSQQLERYNQGSLF